MIGCKLISAIYSRAYRYTFAYNYDPVGNRTAQTATINSTVVTTYTYDNANRLTKVGTASNTWNANGNLKDDGTSVYAYDQEYRLISTTVKATGVNAQFAKNGNGARLE